MLGTEDGAGVGAQALLCLPHMQSTVYSALATNVHLIGHLCSLFPPSPAPRAA